MADTLLRDRARTLRSKGLSLNEITRRLKAPKSTVRHWCRDIILSKKQLERIHHKQKLGGVLAAERLRLQRIRITRELMDEGIKEVGQLSPRELRLVGAALYWAEGYRKGDGEFGFTNSDPKMVKVVLRWLQEICGINKNRIRLRVYLNSQHKKRTPIIQKFWSKTLRIPLAQFTRPTLINVRSRKRYLNQTDYIGTLRVKVTRSTNLRRKIIGWISGIARSS